MKPIARYFIIFVILLQAVGGQPVNAAAISQTQTLSVPSQAVTQVALPSNTADPNPYPAPGSVTSVPTQTPITTGPSAIPEGTTTPVPDASADPGNGHPAPSLKNQNFSVAINPPYLPKSKQINLKFKINPALVVKDSSNLVLLISILENDQPVELEKIPVTNLVDQTRLHIDQGCDDGCTLHIDLLDTDRILGSAETSIQKTESHILSQNGGEFTSQDGKLIVRVGNGALTEDATFYIAKSTDPEIISNSPSGRPFEIDAEGLADGASIKHFNQDIQIIYRYQDGEFPADPSTMSLVYYDETTGLWNYLLTQVDAVNKLLIAASNHLTTLDTDVNAIDKYKFNNLSTAQTSLFTGAATYTYPFNFPDGPGGLKPALALNYSSNTVDSASSLTQASWVGMGWNLGAGSITRNTQGTADLGDDVFSLNLGGSGGVLIPYAYSTSSDYEGWPYVEYHTQDESFTRIRRYLCRTNAPGYDSDCSVWRVWDKAGNLYYFTQGIYYTNYNTQPPKLEMWTWPIQKMTNIDGQTLTFEYDQNATGRVGNGGYNSSDITSFYLKDIVYPNNTYKIFFNRSGRHDINSGCFSPAARCAMDIDKLDSIVIKHSTNGDTNYDDTVRSYSFSYKNEDYNTNHTNGLIFPNLYQSWPHCEGSNTIYWCDTNNPPDHPKKFGVVLALLSVTEYGEGGTGALPPTSFLYEDSMHLTSVTNGYDGKVKFVYENNGNETQTVPWPPTGTIDENTTVEASDPSMTTLNKQCPWLVCDPDYNSAIHPGGVFWIEAMVKSNVSGSSVFFGLAGPGGYDQSVSWGAIPADNTYHNFSAKFLIPITATTGGQNVRVWCYGYCYVSTMSYGAVETHYRVVQKEVFADANSANYSQFSYTYTNPAVNDFAHSGFTSQNDFTKNKVFNKPFSQFMGHQTVTETRPDGHTVTTFNQTGRMAGKILDVKVYTNDASPILMSETINNYVTPVQNPIQSSGTSYLPSCKDINPCNDANIYWTDIASTENRVYASDGTSYLGTRTDYTYKLDANQLPVYGLVETIKASEVSSANPSGTPDHISYSSYDTSRVSTTQYQPGLSLTATLCADPSAFTLNSAPYAVCGSSQGNYLSQSILTYSANGYGAMALSETYTLLSFITPNVNVANDLTNRYFSSSLAQYDTYGNVVRVYQGSKTENGTPVYPGYASTSRCYGDHNADSSCALDNHGSFLLWEKNAKQQQTSYLYDESRGLLTQITDPNLAVTSFEYDQFGRITALRKPGDEYPKNATVAVAYFDTWYPFLVNINVKLDETVANNIRKFYNGLDQLIQQHTASATLLDNNGTQVTKDVVTDYQYDALGRVVEQSAPYDTDAWYNGMPGRSTPFYNNQTFTNATATIYDALGRPTSVTAPDGTVQVYQYQVDVSNNRFKTAQFDAKGNETDTYTDVWGRTILVIPPAGTETRNTYDGANHLTKVELLKRSDGSVIATTNLTYDVAGRKTDMIDPDMGHWSYGYDALGNLTSQTDARGCTTTLTYDALNRVTSKTYASSCPSTPQVTYHYDDYIINNLPPGYDGLTTNAIGRRTAMLQGTSPYTDYTIWSYDSRGLMIQESKTISSTTFKTLWSYDSADQVTSMTYPGSPAETVNYNYFRQQELFNVSSALGAYVGSLNYNAMGQLRKSVLGVNVITTSYTYYPWTDANHQGGKLQTVQSTHGATTLQNLGYTYDPNGNITSIKDGTAGGSLPEVFTYDMANRLTSADIAYQDTTTYDDKGNIQAKGQTQTFTDPFDTKSTTDWTWSNMANQTIYNDGGNNVLRSTGTGVDYGTNISRSSANLTTGHSLQLRFKVPNTDTSSAVFAIDSGSGSTYSFFGFRVQHNWIQVEYLINNGPITYPVIMINNPDGNAWYDLKITLDDVNGFTVQVYKESDPSVNGSFSVMMPTGRNWTFHHWIYRDTDYIDNYVESTTTTTSYGYSSTHVHATTTLNGITLYGYDANGNMTTRTVGGITYTLTYDAENHLAGVTGTGLSATFAYDADGNRVKGTINGVITYYVGNYYEVTGSVIRKYYFAGAQMVAMRISGDPVPIDNGLFFILSDHLGGTSITTDSTGTRVAEVRYTAWGGTRYTWTAPGYAWGSTPTTNAAPTTDRFTGQHQEASLGGSDGLYYYGARWYDSYLNRWSSPDTIIPDQYNPQDWDRYAYVRNNPINFNDPSGHAQCANWSLGCDEETNMTDAQLAALHARRGVEELIFSVDTKELANGILPNASPEALRNGSKTLDQIALGTDILSEGIVGGYMVAGIVGGTTFEGNPVSGFPSGGGVGWILGETNPVVRGLMGLGNVVATLSTMSSVLADAKTGDSRLQMQVFSINGDIKIHTTWTLNASTYVSVTTTAVGWVAPITEESLFFQSIAVANDYGAFSPYSLSYP